MSLLGKSSALLTMFEELSGQSAVRYCIGSKLDFRGYGQWLRRERAVFEKNVGCLKNKVLLSRHRTRMLLVRDCDETRGVLVLNTLGGGEYKQ